MYENEHGINFYTDIGMFNAGQKCQLTKNYPCAHWLYEVFYLLGNVNTLPAS